MVGIALPALENGKPKCNLFPYSSLPTLQYIMINVDWMWPPLGRSEGREKPRTVHSPLLRTRMPDRTVHVALMLFLCFLVEWICNWEEYSKIMKHVSNLKMWSLTHFIFKSPKQNDLPSNCSWQPRVRLRCYFCSTSRSTRHANIPLGMIHLLYTICIGGSSPTLADKDGCHSL